MRHTPNPKKVTDVAEMADLYQNSIGGILTNYRGLTVAEMTQLRAKLREQNCELHVVKNTLFRRAMGDEVGAELDRQLNGPTAIAFIHDDVVGVAKALLEYLRNLRKPDVIVKGAYLGDRFFNPDEVVTISKIPPKPVVLGELVGLLQAPIGNLVTLIGASPSELTRTLQAQIDKQQAA